MPWREQHNDGFTLHLDPVRWKDFHVLTVQKLKHAHFGGNLWLYGKADTARLVEAVIRFHPSRELMRCFLLYDDLAEAIGDTEINRLIECQRDFEAKHPE